MRQIGMRQEASRLGGIGSCGRELCCSTWLTDFKTVSTAAARYQNLSLNTLKLIGLFLGISGGAAVALRLYTSAGTPMFEPSV